MEAFLLLQSKIFKPNLSIVSNPSLIKTYSSYSEMFGKEKNVNSKWKYMTKPDSTFKFYRVLMFTFLSPSIIVAIFCYAIGTDPSDLPVGVINNDVSEGYICRREGFSSCLPDVLSCRFLELFDGDSIKIVRTPDNTFRLKLD